MAATNPRITISKLSIGNTIVDLKDANAREDINCICNQLESKVSTSSVGAVNGVASLDENGRIPFSQLPETAMEYEGSWNASTNTPELKDGTGVNGEFYIVSTPGTVNFGTTANPRTVQFAVNDRVIYTGATNQWDKLAAGEVSSVNGKSGIVTLTANDIEYSTGVTIKSKIDSKLGIVSSSTGVLPIALLNASSYGVDSASSSESYLTFDIDSGVLYSSCLCGTASCADYASSAYSATIAESASSASNSECANNATNVTINSVNTSADYPILICKNSTCTVNKSSGCTFTFNPSSGLLKTEKIQIGSNAIMQYNSNLQSIEFVFN